MIDKIRLLLKEFWNAESIYFLCFTYLGKFLYMRASVYNFQQNNIVFFFGACENCCLMLIVCSLHYNICLEVSRELRQISYPIEVYFIIRCSLVCLCQLITRIACLTALLVTEMKSILFAWDKDGRKLTNVGLLLLYIFVVAALVFVLISAAKWYRI